ncbi:HEAT repeat domain-containing protein [Lysobacter enzymogenes]|uniref:HEAT repeat domain-containing protein n=1 Tax=Lysobacter enzymogenes TaxID=69 RepID=UPI00384D41A8
MIIDFPSPARLPAAWNCYLTFALHARPGEYAFVFSSAELEGAARELQGLPARRLLRLDDSIRNSPRRYESHKRICAYYRRPFRPIPEWSNDRLSLQALEAAGPERAQACLFVASCNYDGYLREYALRAFADRPGRIAMAAALIRCADWADPVRSTAENLLRSLLEREPGHLFDLIELALSMRARERFAPAWETLVEPVLHAPGHAERLWSTIASGSTQVREYVYAAAQATGIRSAAQVCIAALDDPHPRIAGAALTRAETLLGPEELDRQLRLTLDRRFPALRRDALRLAVRTDAGCALHCLTQSLFDRSPGPRRVAAYYLRERFEVEPKPIWREALNAGESRRARIALAAISECAHGEDETSLGRWLQHARPRVRLQALRGLIRGEGPGLADALARALCDADPEVSTEALDAYRRGSVRLTPAALERAWEQGPQYRAQWVAASELLDKWQTLDFLIHTLSQPQPPSLQAAILAGLQSLCARRRLLFDATAEQAPPTLQERLERAGPQLPEGLRRELSTLIPG